MQAGKEDKKRGAEEVITKENVKCVSSQEKAYYLLTGLSILATQLATCLSLSDHKSTWLSLQNAPCLNNVIFTIITWPIKLPDGSLPHKRTTDV